ncbi:DUF4157 domain-containing protein [Nocardioides marinquilinus]
MAEFAHPETDEREQAAPATPVRRVAAPLVVGAADDRAEVEADRVADQVISRLQGGETGETHIHDGCHGVARIAAPSAAPEVGYEGGAISDGLTSRIESKRGTGQALPDDVRSRMESGFGRSLADVRVHTDGESAQLNRSVSARAFTTGNDIFFGAGEFDPGTAAGERVLAHEIAHTQQQGGGARRVHRLWEGVGNRKKRLPMQNAWQIRTLADKDVWFLDGDSKDDVLVVKPDDQPATLGMLAGALHQTLSDAESVVERPLDSKDRGELYKLIGMKAQNEILDGSWADRGANLPAVQGKSPEVAAADNARGLLAQTGKSVVAMSFAAGTSAMKEAKTKTKGEGDTEDQTSSTGLRDKLTQPGHMAALGHMTAIDFLLGNRDRAYSGNLENWFYTPQGNIKLIDHVDPGTGGGDEMSLGYTNRQQWISYCGQMLRDSKHYLADWCVDSMLAKAQTFAGDDDIRLWSKQKPDGTTSRYQQMVAEFERGLKEGEAHIVKVFTTSKWSWKGMKNHHGAKASIKKATKSAGKHGGGDDFYKELKRRAEYLGVKPEPEPEQ